MAILKITHQDPALFSPAVKAFTQAFVAQFGPGATNIFDCLKSPEVEMELVVTAKILEPSGSIRIKELKALTEIIQQHKVQEGISFPDAGFQAMNSRTYTLPEARALAMAACRRLIGYTGQSAANEARSTHVTVLRFNAGWFDTEGAFQHSFEMTRTQKLIAEGGLQEVLLIT